MPADGGGLLWLAYLVTYVIHSTLLLGLAILVTRRLDPRSLRLRERIWKTAVLGGFVTAFVQVGLDIRPPLGSLALQLPAENRLDAAGPLEAGLPAPVDPLATYFQEDSAFHTTWPAPSGQVDSPFPTFPAASPVLARPRTRLSPRDSDTSTGGWPASLAQLSTGFARSALVSLANELEPAAPERMGAAASTRGPLLGAGNPQVDAEVAPFWTWLALAGWSLSALVCALLFAFGWRRLSRELRARHELREGPIHATLERLRLRAGVRRRVRLFVAPGLRAPLSMGWWRPSICMPPRVETELPQDELEAMLAHELAHLARRDPPWLFLLWLCETVFFFQPLNRRARRELADTFELAADAWAVRQTGERLALASCLARIAGWVVGEPAPRADRAWSAAMADSLDSRRSRSRLGARIEHLLDEGSVREPSRSGRMEGAAVFAVLSSLALVVPGATASAPVAAVTTGETGSTLDRLVEHARMWGLHQELEALPARAPSEPRLAPSVPQDESASSDLFAGFDEDLEGLEAEIAALTLELEASPAGDDFAAVLASLRARAEVMRGRRARIQALLDVALEAEARLAEAPVTVDDSEDLEKGRGE